MRFLEVIVFLFYACWLLFSLLAQGETHVNKKVKRVDLFNIIPNYRFFCPTPIQYDYHLYYRLQSPDDSWNNWEELIIGRRHPFWCFIWNPGKKDRKTFYSIVKIIRNNYPKKKKKKGHAYQMLLNYIENNTPNTSYTATQFKITSKQNLLVNSEEILLFTSDEHKI